MNRRRILSAFAAAPVLIACSDDGKKAADPTASGPAGPVAPSGPALDKYGGFLPSTDPARTIPESQRNAINGVLAGSELYAGGRVNFVFGITNKQDEPQGGADTTATFYDLSDPKNPKPFYSIKPTASAPGVGPEVNHTHGNGETHVHGGEDDGRQGYFAPVTFPRAGNWGALVQATLKDGTQGASAFSFEVFAKPRIPAPGQAAPSSDNLTKRDVKSIKEIDSGDPPNDMHDVKIKDAIAAGRPLVVVFATPAYCTSRFCGPVGQEVEKLQIDYKAQVDFVHIEIWRDFNAKQLNPTAREWLLRSDGGLTEPIVYVIGKNGVIYDFWEGPVARNILEPAVKAVAGGAIFGA